MNTTSSEVESRAALVTAALHEAPDNRDHEAVRAYLRRLAELDLSVLFVFPDSKKPADLRAPRDRIAADKVARDAAREAGRRDWQKVKSPSGFELASTDVATLENYLDRYISTFPTPDEPVAVNLAVEVGGSRLVIVDADTPEQVAAFEAACTAGGMAATSATVSTPGARNEVTGEPVHYDGGHWYFTVPEGVEPPKAAGSMNTGTDGCTGYMVRWDRGYVLIPPSTRPEGAYKAVGVVTELPTWLQEQIIEHGRLRAERAARSRGAAAQDDRVTAWGATIRWDEILADTDWINTGKSDSCSCDIWTAPGPHSSPKSATAHEPGCTFYDSPDPPLHIWTDHDIEPFADCLRGADRRTVTRLDAVAAIHYENNLGAAMSALDLHPDDEPQTLAAEMLGDSDQGGQGDDEDDQKAGTRGPKSEHGHQGSKSGGRSIRLRAMSQITDDAPTWAWSYGGHGRIMRGTLVIFGGRPAAGKSTAGRWFAAGFSTGTLDGCFHGQPQTVAYVGTEESYEYLVKPGLRAAGADLDLVQQVIVEKGDQETRLLAAEDERDLTAAFLAAGVTVVIVDPLMSTIDGKVDIYRNNETRQVLEPWARIAQAINGVVIGVAHLVKSPNGDVLAAIQGSSAFGEVARAVFGFAKDDKVKEAHEDAPGVRIMSQVKNSAGREDLSVEYRFIDTEVRTDTGKTANVVRFEIVGTSDRTVADVMRDQARNGGGSRGAGAEVGMWLGKYLSEGPRWAAQGYDDAERAGFSEDQVKRGRRACAIKSLKATGSEGKWYWATEEQAGADEVPAVPQPPVVSEPEPIPLVTPFGRGDK